MTVTDIVGRISVSSSGGTTALWNDVPDLFEGVAQLEFQKKPAVPPGTWKNKIMLETQDGRTVTWKNGQLALTAKSADSQAKPVVFTVLDADFNNKAAKPELDQVCHRNTIQR